MGKILGYFSGSRLAVRTVYIQINGHFIFHLRIFKASIAFVNRGMDVQRFVRRYARGAQTVIRWSRAASRDVIS
jgi:hypothetical protein